MGLPPLRQRLAKGEDGRREFEQIVSVLFSRLVVSGDRDRQIQEVDRGLWLGGGYACLCNDSQSSLGMLSKRSELAKHIKVLVLASLEEDYHQEEQQIRNALVRAGWRSAKSLRVESWDASRIASRLPEVQPLCLRYYPEMIPDGERRVREILRVRSTYDQELAKLIGEIQFVGMSVYKEEASAGIEIEKIYIPLQVVPEGVADEPGAVRTDPLTLLEPGSRRVVLGDPGSGKSTLIRFLALAGREPKLLRRYRVHKDDRLPILITLRRYAEEIKVDPTLSLLEHAVRTARADLNMPGLDRSFFEFFLMAGKSVLFLDGVDELPNPELKTAVRQRVAEILSEYPGNTVLVTSRIVGYDEEARLDSLGFSHHRIAKLGLNDIETFVNDWYRARIPSKAQRDLHAQDLVRILRDADSRAIRELAETPLLLTIICLVHRIDAELPDERVVLYQKCTETLLNTWHTWKFQRETGQSRSKTEQRNRSRMEAIAHWMHGSLEESKEERRAVVAYDDLLIFLADYIRDIERPRNEDPWEIAEVFLRFVKERAGLLVEVGSGQYAFIHLTFQEYLTATHLRKSGETLGMPVVWPLVEQHCADPKWHEVFRLLLGSLERSESQQYLLERILLDNAEAGALERALLAGGCLLDTVAAAEEMRDEILSRLLLHAATEENIYDFRRALRMIRSWEQRDPLNRDALKVLARKAIEKIGAREQETGIALSLIALGWTDEDVASVTTRLWEVSTQDGRTWRVMCEGQILEQVSLGPEDTYSILAALNQAILSSGLDLYVAALTPLCLPAPSPRFSQLLCCIGTVHGLLGDGLFFYSAALSSSISPIKAPTRAAAPVARALDLDLARDWLRSGARAKALDRVRIRALEGVERARLLAREREWRLERVKHPPRRSMLQDQDIQDILLDLLCDILALSPSPPWRESARLRALPQIPERITLTQPQVWEATLKAFREHQATAIDHENAASQLLLDVWLWTVKAYKAPEGSPFSKLAELTCALDTPMLRVAHCIRDIAHGQDRGKDLQTMVESEDLRYRALFEEAFWR